VFNGTVATDTAKANFKPTYLLGGKAADNIIGNDDSETIYGYDGSDFLDGRGGNNSIFAGAGNDIILAASGRDFIDAGDGDDFVEVEGGNNVIILGKGDDKLYIGNGNDVINAGEGADVIQAGHGDNIIILGNPTLAEDGTIISDTDISRNEVYAGHGRDNITGSAGRDIIVGDYLDNKGIAELINLGDAKIKALGYMNDTIRAGDSGDLVMGGLGQDTIYGGKGNDVLIGGSDLIDYSLLKFSPSDVDFIYGEAGDDIILGDSVDDFNTQEYGNYGETEFNANLIDDGQGKYGYTSDFIDGGIGDDYIDGGSGDDTILGGLGQDVLYGGRKVDKITDGEGNDFIIGGIDNDTLISIGDQYHDFFMFGAIDGSDIIKGANTKDSIYFNANVRNDALFKREGNNLVITIKGTNGTKVTVENHFNGNTIDAVIFGDNNPYTLSDLTALKTADGGFLNPTAMKAADGKFLNSTYLKNYSTNRFVQLDYRIKEFEADYKDGTSAFAVNEYSTWYDTNYYTATSDSQIEAETFNGIQIGYEKRKRGWFGGHYSVFKQVKNSILNGTSVALTEKESLDGYFHYTVTQNYDEFNDLIVGAWWGETIKGLDGDDIVFAGSGNDSVEGGDGNDFIHGGDNDDVLTGDGGNSGKEEEHYEYDRIFRTSKWYNYEEVLLKEVETAHDLIFGGDGNDEIYGGFGNDTLYGDSGNDLINGDSGDDNIKGGSGNDTITDTNSHAIIDGGRDDDKITSGNFEDLLWGGEGNDTITSGGGDDVIFADEGDDKIYLGAGTDFAHGGAGNDVIWGEADNDVIHGGDGADAILGGTGSNMLIGGYDNDILYSSGKDILIGGAGNDTVSYFYETASVTINLSGDTPIYGGASANDTFDSIAIYHGSNYNDILVSSKTGTDFRGYGGDDAITGSTVGENLQGNDGNDTIKGNSGGDHMYGGNGNDKIYAGTGDSVRLYGEEGNDTLYLGTGINDANGGNGTDSITYIYSKTGVTINLGTQTVSGGEATGDTIASIENAYGSNYNDIIYGTSGVNTLAGYKGNDFLQGYSGNDVLNGGAGADTIDGGNGIDIVSYADSDAAVRVDLDLGTVSGGTAEGDTLLNVENVNVSKFNDTVIGNDLNNIIRGGEGNDILHGHEGNDTIYGDVGDDVIHSGNDADKLYGGVGNDIFQFSKFNSRATGRDIIYDFEKGKDTLSMTFETDISDIVIQSVTGYNIVSVRGIDFSVQVYGAIAMNDILLAA
jgi:Ca2+-binding RTX toxin-like protein